MQEDRVKSARIPSVFLTVIAITAFVAAGATGFAQTGQGPGPSGANPGEISELQDQVRQLRALVADMRAENAQSREEMHQLRQDLEATRALLEHPPVSTSESTSGRAPSVSPSDVTTAASAQ